MTSIDMARTSTKYEDEHEEAADVPMPVGAWYPVPNSKQLLLKMLAKAPQRETELNRGRRRAEYSLQVQAICRRLFGLALTLEQALFVEVSEDGTLIRRPGGMVSGEVGTMTR